MRILSLRLVIITSLVATLSAHATGDEPVGFRFVSTWAGTQPAVAKSREIMLAGGKLLDAVEQGIRLEEANVRNSTVGIGGRPNADGVVQLDACIMNGPGHQAGAVGAIEDILHPISVARRIMETTKHVLLVGDGAQKFALENGFPKVQLLTDEQRQAWQDRESERQPKPAPATLVPAQHDTIAMLGVDADGNLAGGCSTSGLGYKLAGRVGDSPIIGSGLYVDNEVGGAGATGVGENVMRYCGSFMVVEAMRHGKTPQQACEEVVRRIATKDPKALDELHINFVAIDKSGRIGAAGTDEGFEMATADETQDTTQDAAWITDSASPAD
jgi:N4-(beta-N-acetylglucosaminyl)-L-asparaginase